MIQSTEDKLADKLDSFLQAYGIHPLYFAAIVGILCSLTFYNDLKNWENIDLPRKWLISSVLFGTVVFIIMSIMELF